MTALPSKFSRFSAVLEWFLRGWAVLSGVILIVYGDIHRWMVVALVLAILAALLAKKSWTLWLIRLSMLIILADWGYMIAVDAYKNHLRSMSIQEISLLISNGELDTASEKIDSLDDRGMAEDIKKLKSEIKKRRFELVKSDCTKRGVLEFDNIFSAGKGYSEAEGFLNICSAYLPNLGSDFVKFQSSQIEKVFRKGQEFTKDELLKKIAYYFGSAPYYNGFNTIIAIGNLDYIVDFNKSEASGEKGGEQLLVVSDIKQSKRISPESKKIEDSNAQITVIQSVKPRCWVLSKVASNSGMGFWDRHAYMNHLRSTGQCEEN